MFSENIQFIDDSVVTLILQQQHPKVRTVETSSEHMVRK